jgi:two-component system, cell cycle response regulator
MVRLAQESVLLIGDPQRDVQAALVHALPGAQVTSVPTFFDGIAELTGAGRYTAVLAAAEPIERRPEAAVRTLRELAGNGRVILFGHPSLELLSRKMLDFGCDDYVITPASAAELQQVFARPSLRLAPAEGEAAEADAEAPEASPATPLVPPPVLSDTALAEIVLDALLQHPHDGPAAAVREINARLGPAMALAYQPPGAAAPQPADDRKSLAQPVRAGNDEAGSLSLSLPADGDETAARHVLSQIAHLVGKVAALQDRHNRLQKLAITDELTGVYNARYFRHFLSRILERARAMRFPVTLLLFDIDDFKKYNDQFGHGVGDDILKQTAAMMKAATREHDLVARIGGDEFAVVFWDKEGPRQPHHPKPGVVPSRPPQTPEQIFERFKQKIASTEFPSLGSTGKGALGISGGLAVFPYDAADAQGLIKEADRRLMHGAKRQNGKNTLYIVGPDEPGAKVE